MYFGNMIRYRATRYVSATDLFVLRVTDNLEIEDRLVYQFDKVNIDGDIVDVARDCGVSWGKVLKMLKHDIGSTSNSDLFVFSNNEQMRTFLQVNQYHNYTMEIGDNIALENSVYVSIGDINDSESSAENCYKMLNVLKQNSVKLCRASAKNMLNRLNNGVFFKTRKEELRARCINIDLIVKQLCILSEQTGMMFGSQNNEIEVKSITGTYYISLYCAPYKLCKMVNGKKEVIKNNGYSPLDLIEELVNDENEKLRTVLGRMED